MAKLRRLGRSELEVTPLGLGCWQFQGARGMTGGYWSEVSQGTVNDIVQRALSGGINWFDTAEIYGNGHSERLLAQGLTAAGKKNAEVVIATKWWPLLRTAQNILRTFPDRVEALRPFSIDLHQVHAPVSFSSIPTEMAALAELMAQRKVRAAGVSNFSASRMRRAHAALAAKGFPLATNQMRYSLLDRRVEKNGVLAAAKELGITLIAYSPLAQGVLSGRYHTEPSARTQLHGPRRLMAPFRARGLEKARPVVEALQAIASAHGATPSQVALAWLTQFSGDTVVAIPGATKPHHVADLTAALDLTLSPTELARLDERSRPFL